MKLERNHTAELNNDAIIKWSNIITREKVVCYNVDCVLQQHNVQQGVFIDEGTSRRCKKDAKIICR